jgi:rhamnogalacturonyl hydrolase YesR
MNNRIVWCDILMMNGALVLSIGQLFNSLSILVNPLSAHRGLRLLLSWGCTTTRILVRLFAH